ncbi:hypothetical protein ABH931_006764 [Streptacidiphilus sp. MAP12-33]|uniref:hypothetical protein n=1 Tax=Streptacidiphilus sp. MAP12-33 TaxID=3156266 RepID=UPI003517FE7C
MAIPLGDDAHYVDTTARLFGWQVDWQQRGLLSLRRGAWAAKVHFSPSGGFVRSSVHGSAREARELGLSEVIRLLEREGLAARPSG